jgi:hypothetical protein
MRGKVIQRHPNGQKSMVEYRLTRRRTAVRMFDPEGELAGEWTTQDGQFHGMRYDFYWLKHPIFAQPWVKGVRHGVSYQWDDDGTLLGTFRMNRGTGIDLWRDRDPETGLVTLAEVLPFKNNHFHGFQWWLSDARHVYIERHWFEGAIHGIEREWEGDKQLKADYPKFYVKNKEVSKAAYQRAARRDKTLPPYRASDDNPARIFPPHIAKHLSVSLLKTKG